jgi:hypothetical protein
MDIRPDALIRFVKGLDPEALSNTKSLLKAMDGDSRGNRFVSPGHVFHRLTTFQSHRFWNPAAFETSNR